MLLIEFLKNNLGTIAVLLVVIVVVAALIYKLVKDKKAGKSSCSCGCSSCPMSNRCQSKKEK